MSLGSALGAAAVVFVVLFLAELVDRTNVAVMSRAAEGHAFRVWSGAAGAYVVSSALAVAVGALVLAGLSPYLREIRLVGGAVIVAYGIWALYQSRSPDLEGSERLRRRGPASGIVLSTFALVLLLEMGDNTQVLTLLFAASSSAPVAVFLAASAGLVCASAVGASVGSYLSARVHPRTLRRVFGSVLLVVGGLTILFALLPFGGLAL